METLGGANIPQRPGVYLFRDGRARILYVGKAGNLRSRLRSYFAPGADLAPAKRMLLREAARVTWKETANDIEAFILEAQLIKKLRPKYNVLLRDDKGYFFVGFTQGELPRVFLTHQPWSSHNAVSRKATKQRYGVRALGPTAEYIGPFTDGRALKRTLRLLRRAFPHATHKGFPKRCLEYDLGLCPIPPGNQEYRIKNKIFRNAYQRNIRAIRYVLLGKRRTLAGRLELEMRMAAKRGDFELAAKRRDEMRGLERIFQHRGALRTQTENRITQADIPAPIRRILNYRDPIPIVREGKRSVSNYGGRTAVVRIEGYDIANLAGGKAASGSMAVFVCTRTSMNGEVKAHEYVCRSSNSEYRQFRIKTVRGTNDVAMLAEVLRRRFAHREWPMPDLILIDGGRAQLNTALKTVRHGVVRPHERPLVAALAKRNEEIYLPGRSAPLRLPKNHPLLKLFMHVRDEAHRFARRYHHRLRGLDKTEAI